MKQVRRFLVVVTFLLLTRPLSADEAPAYVEDVQPLLEAKCIACHGREKQKGGLRLDSFVSAKEGGDSGPAIVPGDVAKSLLVKAITFRDPDLQMPPKQKLTDKEIDTLTQWVKAGAAWPEPVAVLFEDEPQFLASLTSGNGKGRLVTEEVFAGKAALGITPLQRDGVKIPGWQFAIREKPQSGEYRFLRLAWKKRGAGSVMIELASNGNWPDAKVAKGRYVAGPNTTGWSAISVSDTAPTEWTVATFDLWKDIGNFTLTGIAPTCDRGEEAFFDAIVLGPTILSLDAYRPGRSEQLANALGTESQATGDAFTDKRNPIRKLFRGERLDLWSLKKPRSHARQSVGDPQLGSPREDGPRSGERGYGSHMIDGFIRERLMKAGLQPSLEADRRTLIRRLTFDLTGLPPNADDVQAFVKDQSPDAYYDKLVDRLLESPRYGERQARLWLDVVRYADTNGYERDEFRPLAWQYRDYVIRSFNQDKPFDQFIREQLAGDELVDGAPTTPAEADMLIATGFLRLGQWDSTASIFQEEVRLRAEQMADLTNTTASAFLGLTISCCQCHDHKYDPLSQADHYRLRAFFAGVTPRDDLAISLADEQTAIDKHNAELDQQAAPLKAEQAKLNKANKPRHEELKTKLAEIESKKRQSRRAMGAIDPGSTAPAIHVFYQGDFSAPRDEVSPGFVSVFTPGPAAIQPPRANTTGRRLALANWIASPENPWTPRVIVNRIWQQHFGTGLVVTPNDFGYSGERPTHPELLDWLAVEFMQRGWSIKELHRLIVKSATYRQGSESGRVGDGENRTSSFILLTND
ncbi:MAG: PSD1 domain-containing protein [Planctomycetaceae bacterium]|nr:PSD1 domain-containing protein [Planctomycetaceae bacterium]